MHTSLQDPCGYCTGLCDTVSYTKSKFAPDNFGK